MAPNDYRVARECCHNRNNNGEDFMVVVDGHPYYPNKNVNVKDETSIQKVIWQLLLSDVVGGVGVGVGGVVVEGNGNGNGNGTSSSSSNESTMQFLQVSKVTGGITNALFQVSGIQSIHKDMEYDSVLVRVFGAEGMIDRDDETSCYAALCEAGMAYRYLGRFGNGRLEGWLEGYRPLQVSEMAQYASSIAIQMARLHSFQLPTNTNTATNDATNNDTPPQPTVWSQLWSWMEQASNHSSSPSGRMEKDRMESMTVELQYLQQTVIPQYTPQISFCHNDLLAANMMILPSDGTIQLIDFEYGGINYTSFDIANHFNEYAGGTTLEENGVPNYSNYPTPAQQRTFLQSYHTATDTTTTTTTTDTTSEQDMLEEIQAFVMLNHLYWGLWAINQAITEGCDEFDYSTYANNRIQQYYICKQQYNTTTTP